jgi:glycine reductase
MRIAHYLNQFFGGIGAEEEAGRGLEIRDGAVGPGKLLETLLGSDAHIVVSFVCGDNYAVEHQDELTAAVIEKLRATPIDLFVAGPCFDAGRYGMAAGAICRAVQTELGIPAVTAMSEENPGVDLHRDALYIIDSGTSVTNCATSSPRWRRSARNSSPKKPSACPRKKVICGVVGCATRLSTNQPRRGSSTCCWQK